MTRNDPNSPSNLDVATVKILTGRIITANPTTGLLQEPFLENHTITVSQKTGRILTVAPTSDEDVQSLETLDAHTIDLREKTVLPGLIDTHVHCEAGVGFQMTCLIILPSLSTPIY